MRSDDDVAGRSTVDDTTRADRALASVPGREWSRSGRGRVFAPGRWLPPTLAIGAVLVLWQILALHNPNVLPTLGAIWSALVEMRSLYWTDTLHTVYESAVGLVGSFLIVFSLAVAMVHSKVVDRAVMPLAVTLNVTPIIAVAPALTIAFGFSYTPKFLITAVIVFFPFLVNGLAGLRSIDPQVLDVFRTLNATRREVFSRLRLPSSLPFLFAAARVCLPLSIVGAVVSEFVASSTNGGLGTLIATAAQSGGSEDVAVIYGAVVILAAIGLLGTFAISVAETRVLVWRETDHRSV